ncbi:sulfite reductase [NADPH] flavoprotein component [Friedmanniomyces endolithicus]|nr:sulfite reductase [NADPH] flavoprotein component [Friedmanniomyces endolithicus]
MGATPHMRFAEGTLIQSLLTTVRTEPDTLCRVTKLFIAVPCPSSLTTAMHLQMSGGSSPNAVRPHGGDEQQQQYKQKSSALPFGQDIALSSVSGPTYLTAQTLVQQVAYALSDKIFAYSPDTFDLDIAARAWQDAQEKNALGEVTGVQSMETRVGAGSIALGYMFSPDFDMSKRHVPQSIIASAASLQHLRPALDQLSLLYDVANPTALQVAAVDYAAETRSGLVTDYCSALTLADELGMGLVSSKDAYEVQHMSLLSTVLASVLPSMHVYDGITVGRETTRVVDVGVLSLWTDVAGAGGYECAGGGCGG